MLFFLLLSSTLLSKDIFALILRSLFLLFLGKGTLQSGGTSPSNSSSIIEGTYYLESSTNFDNYLAELGVNFILRNLASLAKPTVTISRECPVASEEASIEGIFNSTETDLDEDCQWKIYTYTPFKTHTVRFSLGAEVEDQTMDGRSIKSLFDLHNSTTLVEHQIGYVNTTLERTFDADKMLVTLYANDVVASSVFPRSKPAESIEP